MLNEYKKVKISYGHGSLDVDIPKKNLLDVIEPLIYPNKLPEWLDGLKNEEQIIFQAIKNPIGMPPLEKIVNQKNRIAVIVDDITRPTPTKKILDVLFKELHELGVGKKNITIVFANGGHRKLSLIEKEKLLGKTILENYKVIDHDARNKRNLVMLATTSRGTPVLINKDVYEADIRILTGMIKPHSQAGYSGGGKAILPGVSGIETIVADHNYNAVADPHSVYGVIQGNPIRDDIEEAAKILGNCFIINVVLNNQKEIVAAVAGDMVKAHRIGCDILDQMVKIRVPYQADIVITGCGYPTDLNLYQAMNAPASAVRLPSPIVREKGIIIVAASCPEGVGHPEFYHLVSEAFEPRDILVKLQNSHEFIDGQWAAQIWAQMLEHVKIILVCDGIKEQDIKSLKAELAPSIQSALNLALDESGAESKILVMPNAPYTIPVLEKQ